MADHDRRHSFTPSRAAFAPLEESKVVSSYPLMVNPRQVARSLVFALLLFLLSAASVSTAYGQFTLTVSSPLNPAAVDPGENSQATINVAAVGSFDSPVLFDTTPCTVTPVPTTGSVPVCAVSPGSVTPPGQVFLTVTTTGGTPANGGTQPGLYTITVTGTSGSVSQTLTLTLNVQNVTENYSLSAAPTTATPPAVPAGGIATTIVTVNPVASYTGSVTLSCLSVSPVVAAAPYCTFSPSTIVVAAGSPPQTSTLTITTLGLNPTTQLRSRRIFYALWLLIPGLALVGVGATGGRRKHLLGAFLLTSVAGLLLLMPACGSTTNTNSPNGEITPKNTYVFTLTGADQNGAAPSNSFTNPATVTLVVN
jgi:hypothetical protein